MSSTLEWSDLTPDERWFFLDFVAHSPPPLSGTEVVIRAAELLAQRERPSPQQTRAIHDRHAGSPSWARCHLLATIHINRDLGRNPLPLETPTPHGLDPEIDPDAFVVTALQSMLDEVYGDSPKRDHVADSLKEAVGRLKARAGRHFMDGDDTRAREFRRVARLVERTAVCLCREGIIRADSIPAEWSS